MCLVLLTINIPEQCIFFICVSTGILIDNSYLSKEGEMERHIGGTEKALQKRRKLLQRSKRLRRLFGVSKDPAAEQTPEKGRAAQEQVLGAAAEETGATLMVENISDC